MGWFFAKFQGLYPYASPMYWAKSYAKWKIRKWSQIMHRSLLCQAILSWSNLCHNVATCACWVHLFNCPSGLHWGLLFTFTGDCSCLVHTYYCIFKVSPPKWQTRARIIFIHSMSRIQQRRFSIVSSTTDEQRFSASRVGLHSHCESIWD